MIIISLLSVAVYFSVSSSFNFTTTGLNVADRFKNSFSNIGDNVFYAVAILTNQGTQLQIVFSRESVPRVVMHFCVL